MSPQAARIAGDCVAESKTEASEPYFIPYRLDRPIEPFEDKQDERAASLWTARAQRFSVSNVMLIRP